MSFQAINNNSGPLDHPGQISGQEQMSTDVEQCGQSPDGSQGRPQDALECRRNLHSSQEKHHSGELDRVVFFDGVCGLCNQFVDLAMKLDREGRLKFAPIQGETASQLLPAELREKLDTVLFWQEGKLLIRSQAILAIGRQLNGWPSLLGNLGRVVPTVLADLIYKCVSKHRYRIWGKKESCRLPTLQERTRILP